ncbi:MAG: hypothetical protein SNJ54_10385 [Anaerolineae bacterium]
MRKLIAFVIVFVLISAGITGIVIVYQNRPFAPSSVPEQAQIIAFGTPTFGWVPEGIVWDEAGGSFIVGSLLRGDVSRVFPDGRFEVIIRDEILLSTVGLALDDERQRLLVTSSGANAFFGQEGAARLAAYDLTSGQRLFHVDLGALVGSGRSFANDVTVAPDGTAYVTDSFTSVVYQVSAEGEASVLVNDPLLSSTFLGANGIVYHPNGFLLVANSGEKTLLKITLEPTPTVTLVDLDIPFGADGMALAEDGTLFAVARDSDNRQFIAAATSANDWSSASVQRVVETDGNATTLALVNGAPAYINAYLNEFLRRTYQIVQLSP